MTRAPALRRQARRPEGHGVPRHRGPHPHADVRADRRGGAGQRGAGLRPAAHPPPGGAVRPAVLRDHGAVPVRTGAGGRRADGRRVPGTEARTRAKVANVIRGRGEELHPHARPRHQAVRRRRRSERRRADEGVISGEDAFKLHDTYGFYIDITEQMADEAGLTVDRPGYERADGGSPRSGPRRAARSSSSPPIQGELPKTDDSPKYGPPDAPGQGRSAGSRTTPSSASGSLRGDGRGRPAARPHELLRRAGRPGRRHRPITHADGRVRGRGHAAARRRACCTSGVVTDGHVEGRARRSTLRSQRRPRAHHAQPHRHAPAQLGPAQGARRPRRAEGLARRCREDALRLHPRQAADARGDRRVERLVNEQIYATCR